MSESNKVSLDRAKYGYKTFKSHLTPSGRSAVDNGDRVAAVLRGMSLEGVISVLEANGGKVEESWSHLNSGMRRMAAGNVLRRIHRQLPDGHELVIPESARSTVKTVDLEEHQSMRAKRVELAVQARADRAQVTAESRAKREADRKARAEEKDAQLKLRAEEREAARIKKNEEKVAKPEAKKPTSKHVKDKTPDSTADTTLATADTSEVSNEVPFDDIEAVEEGASAEVLDKYSQAIPDEAETEKPVRRRHKH